MFNLLISKYMYSSPTNQLKFNKYPPKNFQKLSKVTLQNYHREPISNQVNTKIRNTQSLINSTAIPNAYIIFQQTTIAQQLFPFQEVHSHTSILPVDRDILPFSIVYLAIQLHFSMNDWAGESSIPTSKRSSSTLKSTSKTRLIPS